MLTVVNKRTHTPTPNDVYIGRSGPNPSPLGNPWSHNPNSRAREITKTRQEAIDKYRIWLNWMIKVNDPYVVPALDAIPTNANLVCHCKPLPCHGDVIKEILEARWTSNSNKQ